MDRPAGVRRQRLGYPFRLLKRADGSSAMEYLPTIILVALVAVFSMSRYGGVVGLKFKCMAIQMRLIRVNPESPVGQSQIEACNGPKADPGPPPPPLPPSEPPGEAKRHHLGDGDYGSPNNPSVGGNLPTEGLNATFNFTLTQDQIDFANAHGGGFVLTFDAYGINPVACMDASCGKFKGTKDSPNTVQFDGNTIGVAHNGTNSIFIPTSGLTPGDHQIQINTGSLVPGITIDQAKSTHNLDDFEYEGVQVQFAS